MAAVSQFAYVGGQMMSQFEDYLSLTAIRQWDWKYYLYDVLISLAGALLATFVIYEFGLYTNFLAILLVYAPVVFLLASMRGFYAALMSLLFAFFSFDLFIIPFATDLPSVNIAKRIIFLCVLAITSLLGVIYSVSHI